jgi:DNA-binding PucR family transcriptional regulator
VANKQFSDEMQQTLDRIGIPLIVHWTPDPSKPIHGEIKHGAICIYDQRQTDALATFTHEIIEFKLKQVTQVYRALINSLIEGYEKLAYQQKEAFIEFLPKLIEAQKLKDNLDQPLERPPQTKRAP